MRNAPHPHSLRHLNNWSPVGAVWGVQLEQPYSRKCVSWGHMEIKSMELLLVYSMRSVLAAKDVNCWLPRVTAMPAVCGRPSLAPRWSSVPLELEAKVNSLFLQLILVIVLLSPTKSKFFLACTGAVLRITWACQPIRLHAWLLRSPVTSFLSQEPKAQEKASSAHWENLGRALARWIQHPEAIQHCLSIVFTQSVQFSSNASNFLHFRPNFSFFYLIFLWTFVKIFPLDSFVNFSNAILCFLTGLFSQTYGLFGGGWGVVRLSSVPREYTTFSHCCKQNPNKKQLKGGRVYLSYCLRRSSPI